MTSYACQLARLGFGIAEAWIIRGMFSRAVQNCGMFNLPLIVIGREIRSYFVMALLPFIFAPVQTDMRRYLVQLRITNAEGTGKILGASDIF